MLYFNSNLVATLPPQQFFAVTGYPPQQFFAVTGYPYK